MSLADDGREDMADKRKYVVDIIIVARVLWRFWLKVTGRDETRVLRKRP